MTKKLIENWQEFLHMLYLMSGKISHILNATKYENNN